MLWQICLILVLIYALIIWWKKRKFVKIAKHFPNGLKAVPFLGHVLHLLGSSHDCMKAIKAIGLQAIARNGLTSVWLAHKYMLVVADPETADVLLKNCLEKDELMNLAHKLGGNGSIFAPVHIWRPRRKILAVTFSQKILNSFVQIFAKQSGIMVDLLNSRLGRGKFPIFDQVTTYTMDSVCETTLGVEMNSQRYPNQPVLKAFTEFFDMAASRLMRPWVWSESMHKLMPGYSKYIKSIGVITNFVNKIYQTFSYNGPCFQNLLRSEIRRTEHEVPFLLDAEVGYRPLRQEGRIIKSKRETMALEENNDTNTQTNLSEESKPRSFLELLIEASGGENGYSDVELKEETLVLVLAGTDTSAVAASFTALLMAEYPDIQERVYQEIREVLGDSDRPIEAGDLPQLKYLDAVVKESLRMYPPVPLIVRTVEKEITLPCGVTLVPGTGIAMHIWAMHRNPKCWGPDVNVFRPERFFDSPPSHPAAYLPFSYGPRSCLGYQYAVMSIKTVLTSIIRKYRILPALGIDSNFIRNTDDCEKEEPILTKYEIMLRHVDNYEIQVELRR